MTRVLPLPAPARTSSGPSPATTASRCAGFRSSSRRSRDADTTRLYPTRQIAREGPNRHDGLGPAGPGIPFFRTVRRRHPGISFAHHVGAMKKILIVEDNEVVQDILRQFFSPRYNVQIAGNASQALSVIVRVAPDVALLDIKMPGLDGISLLKSLREMGVTVPIFIMTGYDSLQVAQDALNAGANG